MKHRNHYATDTKEATSPNILGSRIPSIHFPKEYPRKLCYPSFSLPILIIKNNYFYSSFIFISLLPMKELTIFFIFYLTIFKSDVL